jgi:hypothetical protein
MAMTTRSRCIIRLHRSPIPLSQPYLWRSKACPCAAVVASTRLASASTQGPITFPRMVQGARRIRGLRRIRFTSQRSRGCRHTRRHALQQTIPGSGLGVPSLLKLSRLRYLWVAKGMRCGLCMVMPLCWTALGCCLVTLYQECGDCPCSLRLWMASWIPLDCCSPLFRSPMASRIPKPVRTAR